MKKRDTKKYFCVEIFKKLSKREKTKWKGIENNYTCEKILSSKFIVTQKYSARKGLSDNICIK